MIEHDRNPAARQPAHPVDEGRDRRRPGLGGTSEIQRLIIGRAVTGLDVR